MRGYRLASHFLDPFFFFLLFFDFLRPPGMTGFIAGGLVGDGFGAEASVTRRSQKPEGGELASCRALASDHEVSLHNSYRCN